MNSDSTLILFDWDRTLSDVEGPTNNLLKQTFSNHGDGQFDEFLTKFRSPSNQGRKIIDRLQEILGEEMGALYYQTFLYIKKYNSDSKPRLFEGIATQLKEVKMRCECILGIVTNKNEDDVIEEDFESIADVFQFIVGGKGVSPELLKPSGYLINLAISRANSQFQRVLMFGDTSHDINALGNAEYTGEKIGVLSTWGISEIESRIQLDRINTAGIDRIIEISSVSQIGNTLCGLINTPYSMGGELVSSMRSQEFSAI